MGMCRKEPHCPWRQTFMARSFCTRDRNSLLVAVMRGVSLEVRLLLKIHLYRQTVGLVTTHTGLILQLKQVPYGKRCMGFMHKSQVYSMQRNHKHLWTGHFIALSSFLASHYQAGLCNLRKIKYPCINLEFYNQKSLFEICPLPISYDIPKKKCLTSVCCLRSLGADS